MLRPGPTGSVDSAVTSPEPGPKSLQPGQGGTASKDLHGLEQGRRDLPPGHRDAQRTVCQTRFDPLAVGHAPPLDDGGPEGLLQMVLVPLLRVEPLQGADARIQHVSGRGLELGQSLVVDDEIVVGHEEEAEHVAALAQQLDPRLNKGGTPR